MVLITEMNITNICKLYSLFHASFPSIVEVQTLPIDISQNPSITANMKFMMISYLMIILIRKKSLNNIYY